VNGSPPGNSSPRARRTTGIDVFPPEILSDLYSSGIKDETIARARIRPATPAELLKLYTGKKTSPAESWTVNFESEVFAPGESKSPLDELDTQPAGFASSDPKINVAGIMADNPKANKSVVEEAKLAYVIPYFDIHGNFMREFFRYKLIPPLIDVHGKKLKYLQVKSQKNRAYLPPTIPTEAWYDTSIPIIITEGEKKALCVSQYYGRLNMLTMGVGGVDSWRNRIVAIDADNLIDAKEGKIKFKIKSGAVAREVEEQITEEFLEIPWNNRKVYIIYDTDFPSNPSVQRAAFELGLFLEEHGAIPVQVFLPTTKRKKVGLDDYVVAEGIDTLKELIEEGSWFFPCLPEELLKIWITRQLDLNGKRQVHRKVARAILANLDKNGKRFKDRGHGYFYFDSKTKALHSFRWDANEVRSLRLSTVGQYLMNTYGVGTADTTALARLADLFTATQPITEIKPRHIVTTTRDALYYQISNSRMAKITRNEIVFCDNGTDDILFISDENVALDEDKLIDLVRVGRVTNLWYSTLQETTIEPLPGLSLGQTHKLISCIFYLNPWFRRWRELMLPVEIIESEAGSGKTVLLNLKRGILTGNPSLDNPPDDAKDWYAAISAAPATWVCDNLGDSMDPKLRMKMSDELARLTTEPDPGVSVRELYTTSEVARIPIDCTFTFTTIRSHFHKPDLLQRALLFRMSAVPAGKRDGQWYQRKMANREQWIAEHLLVSKEFLTYAHKFWSPNYLSGHRLANLEQSLKFMGMSLGYDRDEMETIISKLPGITNVSVAESDPMSEALRTFAVEHLVQYPAEREVSLQKVIDWARDDLHSRYSKLYPLQNSVVLGKYIQGFRTQMKESSGVELFAIGNKRFLRILIAEEDAVEEFTGVDKNAPLETSKSA
jgi:hypothetical protein